MKFFTWFAVVFFPVITASQKVITGQILDIGTTKPVAFAFIEFTDLETGLIADSSGKFSLENPPVMNLAIRVIAVGFETLEMHWIPDSTFQLTIFLHPIHKLLDHVDVSASEGLIQRENVTHVVTMKLSEINMIPSATLGESLANIPGVYQSTTGTGISKPVVRGLSGPRVVTWLNGLRIENQQWGEDHGMGITDIGIGSVEVIKGPASVLYGSDALGGVLFFTDEPYASPGTAEGYFKSRFDAGSFGITSRAGAKFNARGFKVNVFAGATNHGDFRLPNGKYAVNTRFAEHLEKLSVGYNRKRWVINLRFNAVQQLIGIPGHAEDSVFVPEDFQSPVSERELKNDFQRINNYYVSLENKFLYRRHQFVILTGFTNNRLQEFEENLDTSALDMRLKNLVCNLKWVRNLTPSLNLILGTQGMLTENKNGNLASEVLIPNAQTGEIGMYGLLSFQRPKWRCNLGGRYDHRQLLTYITAGQFLSMARNFDAWNYSAGATRQGKVTTVSLNISSGFRAPSSAELLSSGPHHGALRYEAGNINLKTEKALQIDLSFGFHHEHIEFLLNPYVNMIQDFISLDMTDSVIDGLPLFEFTQKSNALLYGTDAGLHYHSHFAHWLHFETGFSAVMAEESDGTPLTRIPQTRSNNQVKIEIHSDRKFSFEHFVFQYVHCFRQSRVAGFETPTGGYDLLNVNVGLIWRMKYPVVFSIGAKNALNAQFTDHLSRLKNVGLPNPGWNLFATVKINFSPARVEQPDF